MVKSQTCSASFMILQPNPDLHHPSVGILFFKTMLKPAADLDWIRLDAWSINDAAPRTVISDQTRQRASPPNAGVLFSAGSAGGDVSGRRRSAEAPRNQSSACFSARRSRMGNSSSTGVYWSAQWERETWGLLWHLLRWMFKGWIHGSYSRAVYQQHKSWD